MSVALRTITRLQDADDINVTLGVGVDEYALCWDNDTARFVLRAMSAGVTDHGALTGLSDDDHSQYLLATGTRTGASSQAQAFTGGIVASSFIGGSAVDQAVTIKITSGVSAGSYLDIVGGNNGGLLLARFNGTNGSITVPNALNILAGGYIGCEAGAYFYQIGGTTYMGDTLVNFNTSTNFTLKPRTDGQHILLVPDGGYCGVGVTPATKLHVVLASAVTNAVTNVVTIGHDTSGTPAAGFGAGELFQLESSTTAAQSAARIQAIWNDATHATRKADLVLTAYDTAEREGLRIRGAGSAPAIGFLGAAPTARVAHVADPSGGSTVDAEARSAINSILATLEIFGFHATS